MATGLFLNIFFWPSANSNTFFQRKPLLSDKSSGLPNKIFLRIVSMFFVKSHTAVANKTIKKNCGNTFIKAII